MSWTKKVCAAVLSSFFVLACAAPELDGSWREPGNTSPLAVRSGNLTSTAGLDVSVLFDPAYYSALYPDLQNAFHGDVAALRNHWLTDGIYQGRRASPIFDCAFYMARYADIRSAFSGDCAGAMAHFRYTGLQVEGRRGSVEFDAAYYLRTNPDVKAAFGATGYALAASHFAATGYAADGRAGSFEFDPAYYLCNAELINVFGRNYRAGMVHWVQHGLAEGRRSSPGFHVGYYLSHHADLVNAFGPAGFPAALEHWFNFGRSENRTSNPGDGADGFRACNPMPLCDHVANRQFDNYFDSLTASIHNVSEYSKTQPECSVYLLQVVDFQSDMAHVSLNAAVPCSSVAVEILVNKWIPNGTGTGIWSKVGTLRRTSENAAKTGASFTDSSGRCSVGFDINGSNAPFLVKGDTYQFAIKAYSATGTNVRGATPLEFEIWSNIRAGISTMAATPSSFPIDRWTTWLSVGKAGRTDNLQSDPRYGLEPPTRIIDYRARYERPDYTDFAIPMVGPKRAFVAEGALGDGNPPAVSFAITAGKRVDTGVPIIQFRFGSTDWPIYAYMEPKDANTGTLFFKRADGSALTLDDVQWAQRALAAYADASRAASSQYSCEGELFELAASVALAAVGVIGVALSPPTGGASAFVTGVTWGAGGAGMAVAGVKAFDCISPPGPNVPEPKPDIKPVPFPPDPTPNAGPDFPPGNPSVVSVGGAFSVPTFVCDAAACPAGMSCKMLPSDVVVVTNTGRAKKACWTTCTVYSNGMRVCGP